MPSLANTYPEQPADKAEMTLHFLDYWKVVSIRWPLILLVFLLVVITAGIVTYLMPREYMSVAAMQVRNDTPTISVFNQVGGTGFDPRFITTQFEIIQKKEVLYPVIKNLSLQDRWGLPSMELAYSKLRKSIDVREVRNTELIEIIAYSTDPEEAALIANSIAEEYQRQRIEEQQQLVDRSLKQLEDEVSKQKAKVDALYAEMTRLRLEYGIQDLNPDGVEDPMQVESALLMSVEQQVNDERMKASILRSRFDQISQMTDDQIMRSLMTLEIDDPTVQQFLPIYQDAESQLALLLASGLGPKHPRVESLRAKKDVIENQLKEQIAVIRKSLEANLIIAEESLKAMETRLAESRSNQQEAKTRAATYYEAKNTFIQARRVLEAAETKLTTERMQRAMPDSPATIWEMAEPSEFPARPRVLLNMALAVVVGLVFGVGLAFFIEYLDTSIKTLEEIENILQVPLLAVIPKNISNLIDETDDNPDAEAYRIMRTNIEFNRKNPEANTITVVSGGPGEGKSTTLNNLACVFARGGYSTLIVDADFRRPSQHRIFGIQNVTGLSDFLTHETQLEELIRPTKENNLYFMPSGKLPVDAVGVLNSQRMLDLVELLKGRFDMVFFDSPPILGVSDASVICSAVDLTLIVTEHRRYPRSVLQRVKSGITNVGGSIVGVVLNKVDIRHDSQYSYYTSYYSYYNNAPAAAAASAAARKGQAPRAAKARTPEKTSRPPAYAPHDEEF